MKESKWIGFKHIVLIALLTALVVVIQLVTGIPFAASPQLMMFISVAISMVLCGPIYVLMVNKAPRIGTVVLFALVQAIYYLIIGQLWIGVMFLAGGVLSELVMHGGYKKPVRIGVSYVIYAAAYAIGSYFPYILLKDQYLQQMTAMGYPQEMINNMLSIFASPVFVSLATLNSCVWAALGAFIGYKMMKKHFQPAGIVSE